MQVTGCHHGGRVLHGVVHPVHEVGHVGVDPVEPGLRTAPPPADHARQEVGGAVLCDQRAAVVSTATVLATLQVPGAQHVTGEVELGSLGALGVLDDGDGHSAEDGGDRSAGRGARGLGVAPRGPLAPARHGVVAD